MRELVHWQEVPCGSCGEALAKHLALFAKTGDEYRCWACDAKENSPTLRQEKPEGEATLPDPEGSVYSVILSALWPLIGVQVAKIIFVFGCNL